MALTRHLSKTAQGTPQEHPRNAGSRPGSTATAHGETNGPSRAEHKLLAWTKAGAAFPEIKSACYPAL